MYACYAQLLSVTFISCEHVVSVLLPSSGSGRHHLLPLLSSLSSLVLYLRRLQHSAFLSLSRQLQSAEAWRLLCHSSLALLILYNRRRECEVSKL